MFRDIVHREVICHLEQADDAYGGAMPIPKSVTVIGEHLFISYNFYLKNIISYPFHSPMLFQGFGVYICFETLLLDSVSGA